MTTERFIVPVDENGNLQFTKELLAQTGWKPGTQLDFIDNGDGTVTMFEKEQESDDGYRSEGMV